MSGKRERARGRPQCCAEVRSTGFGMSSRARQCSNKSVVVVDGKPYCHVHDPAAVHERKLKKQDHWKKVYARRERDYQDQVLGRGVRLIVAQTLGKDVSQLKNNDVLNRIIVDKGVKKT